MKSGYVDIKIKTLCCIHDARDKSLSVCLLSDPYYALCEGPGPEPARLAKYERLPGAAEAPL